MTGTPRRPLWILSATCCFVYGATATAAPLALPWDLDGVPAVPNLGAIERALRGGPEVVVVVKLHSRVGGSAYSTDGDASQSASPAAKELARFLKARVIGAAQLFGMKPVEKGGKFVLQLTVEFATIKDTHPAAFQVSSSGMLELRTVEASPLQLYGYSWSQTQILRHPEELAAAYDRVFVKWFTRFGKMIPVRRELLDGLEPWLMERAPEEHELTEAKQIAFLDLKIVGYFSKQVAQRISATTLEAIRAIDNTNATDRAGIDKKLGSETGAAMAACEEAACLTKHGKALGVDWVVTGSVKGEGQSAKLELWLVNVATGAVLSRSNAVLTGPQTLKRTIGSAVLELLGGAVAAERKGSGR